MSTHAAQPFEADRLQAERAALFELTDIPLDEREERHRATLTAALDELAHLRASEAHDAIRLLKEEVHRLSVRRDALEATLANVRELLRWTMQKVHQAYHEQPFEDCPKATCSAVRDELGRAL